MRDFWSLLSPGSTSSLSSHCPCSARLPFTSMQPVYESTSVTPLQKPRNPLRPLSPSKVSQILRGKQPHSPQSLSGHPAHPDQPSAPSPAPLPTLLLPPFWHLWSFFCGDNHHNVRHLCPKELPKRLLHLLWFLEPLRTVIPASPFPFAFLVILSYPVVMPADRPETPS